MTERVKIFQSTYETLYVKDLLVRTSESFEPSKSWKKKASNRQKNLKKCSSRQPSFNHQVAFETILAGSFFRPHFRRVFYRRGFTNDDKFPHNQSTLLCVFGMN